MKAPAAPLRHIMKAIQGIEETLAGRNYDDFKREWAIKHAVERGIEIISEASRRLPDEALASEPDLPWKQIKGIGNILRHEYHDISDDIVWDIVLHEIPRLKASVERLLQENEDPA
ncbi:MAG: DUF86 domain-containing protein [Rhodomicrobium sp.]